MEKSKNMKCEDAAKIMGKDVMFVRMGLRQKTLPFGHAVLTQTNPDRWSYHISRKKFVEYMGEAE